MRLLILLLWLPGWVWAQRAGTDSLRLGGKTVVKLAPLALIDPDATIQFGLERRLGPRRSVQAEAGYGWSGLQVLEGDLSDYRRSLYRFRTELRYYTGRYRTNRRKGIAVRTDFPLGNYWGPELLVKQINFGRNESIWEFSGYSPDGRANYRTRELGFVERSRLVLGGHLKMGRQIAFYNTEKATYSRVLLDLYVGIGARWAVTKGPAQELCGCGFGPNRLAPGRSVLPSLTAGIKLGLLK